MLACIQALDLGAKVLCEICVGSKVKGYGIPFPRSPRPHVLLSKTFLNRIAQKKSLCAGYSIVKPTVFSPDIFSVSHQFYFRSRLDGNYVHGAVFFSPKFNSNKPVDVNNYSSLAREYQGGSFSQNMQFYSSLGAYTLDKKLLKKMWVNKTW